MNQKSFLKKNNKIVKRGILGFFVSLAIIQSCQIPNSNIGKEKSKSIIDVNKKFHVKSEPSIIPVTCYENDSAIYPINKSLLTGNIGNLVVHNTFSGDVFINGGVVEDFSYKIINANTIDYVAKSTELNVLNYGNPGVNVISPDKASFGSSTSATMSIDNKGLMKVDIPSINGFGTAGIIIIPPFGLPITYPSEFSGANITYQLKLKPDSSSNPDCTDWNIAVAGPVNIMEGASAQIIVTPNIITKSWILEVTGDNGYTKIYNDTGVKTITTDILNKGIYTIKASYTEKTTVFASSTMEVKALITPTPTPNCNLIDCQPSPTPTNSSTPTPLPTPTTTPSPIPTQTATPSPIPTQTAIPSTTPTPDNRNCSNNTINEFNKNINDSNEALNKLSNLFSLASASSSKFSLKGFYTDPMYDQETYSYAEEIKQRTAEVRALETSALAEERQAYKEYYTEAGKIIGSAGLVIGTAGMSTVPSFLTSIAGASPEVLFLALESPQVISALNRAAVLISALKVLNGTQCLEPSLVSGVNTSKSALSTIDDKITNFFKSVGKSSKNFALPTWLQINKNWTHIFDRHMFGGSGATKGKDLFPASFSQNDVKKAVEEAYKSAKKIGGEQIDDKGAVRITLHGYSQILANAGLTGKIEMYFNKTTSTIETAYPKPGY